MTTEEFLGIFRQALKAVEPLYYGDLHGGREILDHYLPGKVRSSQDPLTQAQVEELKDFLKRYDERVFCYELYHQVRSIMDLMEKEQPRSTFPFRFQGELKKRFLQGFVAKLSSYERLDAEYVPDFLLHSPGEVGYSWNNGLIIEVKCLPNIPFSKIETDLQKIQEFIHKYKYEKGLFLVTNNAPRRIHAIITSEEAKNWMRQSLPDSSRILLFVKESAYTELTEYCLGDLLA